MTRFFATATGAAWKHSKLPSDILPIVTQGKITGKPTYLVTGATGFVGPHIAQALLSESSNVLFLVRGSEEAGIERLYAQFEKLGLETHKLDKSMGVLPGDITQPKLGLSDHDYVNVANIVTSVFHSAAWANHVRPYDVLYATNVASVIELLRFCTTGRNKTFNFVSSMASLTELEDGKLTEALPTGHEDTSLIPTGYGQTKYEAERLIAEAINQGIHCNIFRLGQMTGHSRTGKGLRRDDHLMNQLRACIHLGMAPNWDNAYRTFIPVNYAGEIITDIGCAKGFASNAYNISYESISFKDIIEYLNQLGYNITFVTGKQWMNACLAQDESFPLYHLLNGYTEDGEMKNMFPRMDQISANRVITKNTDDALCKLGIYKGITTPRGLLTRYVRHFQEVDFFPMPATNTESLLARNY